MLSWTLLSSKFYIGLVNCTIYVVHGLAKVIWANLSYQVVELVDYMAGI